MAKEVSKSYTEFEFKPIRPGIDGSIYVVPYNNNAVGKNSRPVGLTGVEHYLQLAWTGLIVFGDKNGNVYTVDSRDLVCVRIVSTDPAESDHDYVSVSFIKK